MRTSKSGMMIFLIVIIFLCCQFSFTAHVLKYGGKFDLAIPDADKQTQGWMTDAIINIDEHMTISDIDVLINIKHTNVFDLNILLQGPVGTEICLNSYKVKDFFIDEDYFDTVFDDEALVKVEDAKAPFNGKFKPKNGNLLSSFDGIDAYGQWKLRIEDLWKGDSGKLNKFEIRITVPEPATIGLLLIGTLLSFRAKRSEVEKSV